MIKIITDRLKAADNKTKIVATYNTPNGDIPIFHVYSMSEFNRIIGYAKHINASSGTVLYRGQNQNYPSVLPSGARTGRNAVKESLLVQLYKDDAIKKFYHLTEEEIKGWELYGKLVIEASLQHYGANTYCMDFVDNHWVALWFGAYQFQKNHYVTRGDNENLYVIMYLADTNGQSINGLYIGEDSYTLDLRKVLPSTFQRPASQHGWIVRKKERKTDKSYYDYKDRVIGIIEVTVYDAKKWLGNGLLLSEENFFPSPKIDNGYNVLLSRQRRSGIPHKYSILLPFNTICNYHINESFYYSNDDILSLSPIKKDKYNFSSITDLFERLLYFGWQENTCQPSRVWNENKPWVGQSFASAALVNQYFGGDIYSFKYSDRYHFFNVIGGKVVDLASLEIEGFVTEKDICDRYIQKNPIGIGKQNKQKSIVSTVLSNCK